MKTHEVQYYDHELGKLEHTWLHKIRKILEHNCIQEISSVEFICKPIVGYNQRTYSLKKQNFEWVCNCQGFKKRFDCSHKQALIVHLKSTD